MTESGGKFGGVNTLMESAKVKIRQLLERADNSFHMEISTGSELLI